MGRRRGALCLQAQLVGRELAGHVVVFGKGGALVHAIDIGQLGAVLAVNE